MAIVLDAGQLWRIQTGKLFERLSEPPRRRQNHARLE